MAKPQQRTPATDWDGIVRRQICLECRNFDEATRSFDIVASTASLDSHGDIVEQSFKLERYLKNPVVLWNHNIHARNGDDPEGALPIGHSSIVTMGSGELVARMQLIIGTADEEPLIDKIWRRVVQKAIRAASIGFMPGKITEEKLPGGGVIYHLSENELYEISLVPIPSNPDAVAKSIAADRSNFRRICGDSNHRKAEDMGMELTEHESLMKAADLRASDALKAEKLKTEAAEALNAKAATELIEVRASLDVVKAQNAELEKRVSAADGAVAAAEVKALVGVKLTPAEEKAFLELRLSNKELFDTMIAAKSGVVALTTPLSAEVSPKNDKGSSSLVERAKVSAN